MGLVPFHSDGLSVPLLSLSCPLWVLWQVVSFPLLPSLLWWIKPSLSLSWGDSLHPPFLVVCQSSLPHVGLFLLLHQLLGCCLSTSPTTPTASTFHLPHLHGSPICRYQLLMISWIFKSSLGLPAHLLWVSLTLTYLLFWMVCWLLTNYWIFLKIWCLVSGTFCLHFSPSLMLATGSPLTIMVSVRLPVAHGISIEHFSINKQSSISSTQSITKPQPTLLFQSFFCPFSQGYLAFCPVIPSSRRVYFSDFMYTVHEGKVVVHLSHSLLLSIPSLVVCVPTLCMQC